MEENINIKAMLESYKSLVANKEHIKSIDKEGFFEFADCIIKAYKELEYKYNKALSDLVQAEHKNKEIEEENKDLKNLANNKQWISPCYVAQNYIQVSLVEEKIEELNRKIKYEDNEKVTIWLHKQRKILQELLEKRK